MRRGNHYNTIDMNFLPSAITLILANLIPIFGVYFFHWEVGGILLVYWLESGIIGYYTVLKVRKAVLPSSKQDIERLKKIFRGDDSPLRLSRKEGEISFVIVYAAYMFIHGALLMSLIAYFPAFSPGSLSTLVLSIVPLFISHNISYRTNFIGKQEFLRISPARQMLQPYRRIAVMHITVYSTFFFFSVIPEFMVFVIVVKTLVDLWYHLKEHRDLSFLTSDRRRSSSPRGV